MLGAFLLRRQQTRQEIAVRLRKSRIATYFGGCNPGDVSHRFMRQAVSACRARRIIAQEALRLREQAKSLPPGMERDQFTARIPIGHDGHC
jgi:hypothetical protein